MARRVSLWGRSDKQAIRCRCFLAAKDSFDRAMQNAAPGWSGVLLSLENKVIAGRSDLTQAVEIHAAFDRGGNHVLMHQAREDVVAIAGVVVRVELIRQ